MGEVMQAGFAVRGEFSFSTVRKGERDGSAPQPPGEGQAEMQNWGSFLVPSSFTG